MDSENQEEVDVMDDESSSSSDEESDSSEDEIESESDEENASVFFMDDAAIYKQLIDGLDRERKFGPILKIKSATDARVMLENMDSICMILSSMNRLSELAMGDGSAHQNEAKIEINEENSEAWDNFFTALATLENIVDELYINSINVSAEVIVEVLASTSHLLGEMKFGTRLCIPWYSSGDELGPLVEAVPEIQRGHIRLVLCANGIPEGTTNHFENGNIFNLIRRGGAWRSLGLRSISFSLDQSKSLARILSTGSCVARLSMTNCSFDEGGGEFVARAFVDTTSLKSIELFGNEEDESFWNAFVQSFPSATSVEELNCWSKVPTSLVETLIKNVARQNDTLKYMHFSTGHKLSPTLIQGLKSAVSRNYTLKSISFDYWESYPFADITRLNAAGRRYLTEDDTSRSKNIAVLAKVKHDLDCLYYHMRENPILCMSDSQSVDVDTDEKCDLAFQTGVLLFLGISFILMILN